MPLTYGESCWVFVCNPKKWHVDDFLRSGERFDSWALDDRFLSVPPKPGDVALIRAGNDARSDQARNGNPKLTPGIYALCEITSGVYRGQGVSSRFWHGADESPRSPDEKYSTVDWQLVASFLAAPITVDRIRSELPGIQTQVINQPQARSYPLSRQDFDGLLFLAGIDEEAVTDLLRSTPKDLDNATPRRREVVQKRWERGTEGRRAKQANGHRCQLCEALSKDPIAFHKPDGAPYVEAHHVVPVSTGGEGLLRPSNIITVCANHHLQLHFGGVAEPEDRGGHFVFRLPEGVVEIKKLL